MTTTEGDDMNANSDAIARERLARRFANLNAQLRAAKSNDRRREIGSEIVKVRAAIELLEGGA